MATKTSSVIILSPTNTPIPSIDGSVSTTSSVATHPSISPPVTIIHGVTSSLVVLPTTDPPAMPVLVTTHTSSALPPFTPSPPFFRMLDIILMASAGALFVLVMIMALFICCCLCCKCCRRKEIKASSVAELCDLSHYDDILTRHSNNPSCGTTSAIATLNTNQGTSHFPNSVRGQSSANTGITADSGQEGGISNQDMQGVGKYASTTGQHKMMKQVSTSSIQVGEELDWGTVPTLSRGKRLFRK